jgi:hypothetical protein
MTLLVLPYIHVDAARCLTGSCINVICPTCHGPAYTPDMAAVQAKLREPSKILSSLSPDKLEVHPWQCRTIASMGRRATSCRSLRHCHDAPRYTCRFRRRLHDTIDQYFAKQPVCRLHESPQPLVMVKSIPGAQTLDTKEAPLCHGGWQEIDSKMKPLLRMVSRQNGFSLDPGRPTRQIPTVCKSTPTSF